MNKAIEKWVAWTDTFRMNFFVFFILTSISRVESLVILHHQQKEERKLIIASIHFTKYYQIIPNGLAMNKKLKLEPKKPLIIVIDKPTESY